VSTILATVVHDPDGALLPTGARPARVPVPRDPGAHAQPTIEPEPMFEAFARRGRG